MPECMRLFLCEASTHPLQTSAELGFVLQESQETAYASKTVYKKHYNMLFLAQAWQQSQVDTLPDEREGESEDWAELVTRTRTTASTRCMT